ncbi:MAG: cbb3-type cytochrome c oxidase subunit 3 [Caulobacterales bacterium]|nr:cbb3-type cytochrome c oxidase subunit 3 [Caulobacterales bacterium]
MTEGGAYGALASFAQVGGLLIFVAAFLMVLIYALWPGSGEKFSRAARQPMGLDDPDDRPAESER